jgi:hypothetical protein
LAAFEAARKSLSATAVLGYSAAGAELSLVTDGSSTQAGAIQQRRLGRTWQPLGFFSAQLDKAQVNYRIFSWEMFAVVVAIKHFHYKLEWRSFVIFTNYKLLVGVLGS